MRLPRLFLSVALPFALFTAALPPAALARSAPSAVTPDKTIDPPAGDWGPGDFPAGGPYGQTYLGISGVSGQDGLTREYKVHVPQSYRHGVPAPLVFCFPGFLENTSMFCVTGSNTGGSGQNGTTGGFIDLSEQNGFILVMAQGYDDSWNGGTCCGAASLKQLDDVALVRAILAVVEQHLTVDPNRIYAAGFSNGAFLSDRLACEASDIFAAILEGSGGIQLLPMSDCQPTHKVSVLAFHGTKDLWVPYYNFTATQPYFAGVDGCSMSTTPAQFPNSGGDTSCVTYTGCPAGITVTGCTIDGGGHCWYGSPSCGTGFGLLGAAIALDFGHNSDESVESADLWTFFSSHPKQ